MELFNKYFGGILMPAVLIVFGIYFSVKFKLFYIFHPIKCVKSVLKASKSGVKSLFLALAGTLGVGNIVGVAGAIMSGGAGSIFWMWISAILAMSLKYAEVCLSIKFKRHEDGKFRGGAPYYIRDGLSKKIGKSLSVILSCIFAFLCIINSLSTGNLVQINAVCSIGDLNKVFIGVGFSLALISVIIGGKKRIEGVTSFLIPTLSLLYVLICTSIIFLNFDKVPSLLLSIFKDAFSLRASLCGFFGYGCLNAMRFGITRGILSNEAGCGTSPCAHASSDTTSTHTQGCLGIFEVVADTLIMCTMTAFVILLSPTCSSSNAMGLVLDAFSFFLGDWGKYFIIITCFLFAFATVVCQFFYGSESVYYLSKSKFSRIAYSAAFIGVILLGAIIPMQLMWQISDLVIAVMTVFNIACLFALRKSI